MTDLTRRHANVVRAEELPARAFTKGTRFGLASRALGRATGSRGIGCSLYEVPPGRTAFPHHYHAANEESVYILEGEGTLRIGADTVVVSAGDYATFPVGPQHAHQLLNTGTGPLRYLCFSTMAGVEVVGYPDSRKVGALAYGPAGEQWVRHMSRDGESLDYYDGEDG
jgi:uncharacterized cupin superfamily protein